MDSRRNIICTGEILWDALPSGLFLGGAPLNVCCHLNRLGIDADILSRVGSDRLGKEAVRRIAQQGISTALIQSDPREETGFVEVEITAEGEPSYRIIRPVAWDFIEKTPEAVKRAGESWGIVCGTLAQRNEVSRRTIRSLWQADTRKILDLNLRKPYDDREIVRESLLAADIVKMNGEELRRVTAWFSLSDDSREAAGDLSDLFGCSLICITRGAGGAAVWQNGEFSEHNGYPVKVKDSVGSGDAFFAALIYGLQREKRGEELLSFANAAGSLVAGKQGAIPEYNISDINEITGNDRTG